MKILVTFSAFFSLLLAGCSSEESTPAEAPVAQSQPEPAVQETAAEETEDSTEGEEEQPQMVEESASEPDEEQVDDKPILLAEANTAAASHDWKFKQDTHYFRLQSAQPVIGGPDKIEVAEVFWYGCAHCYDFEPYINSWAEDIPDNVRFVRIPATWNALLMLHAQLYYTEEVLVKNGQITDPEAFRSAIFAEYHRRSNRMTSKAAIQDVFERNGVSAEDFTKTWNSFEVATKLNKARDLAIRYGISGVPAVVVNGKYRTGASQEVQGYAKLLEVVDELVVRESI